MNLLKIRVYLAWAQHWQVIAEHWLSRGPDFNNIYEDAIGRSEWYLIEVDKLVKQWETKNG